MKGLVIVVVIVSYSYKLIVILLYQRKPQSDVFFRLFRAEEEERMLAGLSVVVSQWSSLGSRLGGHLSVVAVLVFLSSFSPVCCYFVCSISFRSRPWESVGLGRGLRFQELASGPPPEEWYG